jgi:hypothetical protein
MPVAVELQPGRGPGGDPEVAGAKRGMDVVEVVPALRLGRLEGGLPALFVAPGPERGAELYG